MINYPTQPQHSDVDDALRVMVKIVVYSYLIIAGALALVAGITIVGLTAAYLLLRVIVNVLAMLLHKHTSFSFRDALYSLLQETRRYAKGV